MKHKGWREFKTAPIPNIEAHQRYIEEDSAPPNKTIVIFYYYNHDDQLKLLSNEKRVDVSLWFDFFRDYL